MYCGFSGSSLVVRGKPSFYHPRRVSLLDDGGGVEFSLQGLSLNPRFLLYGYYLRRSSLIYWSPLRTFLTGHGEHIYSSTSPCNGEPRYARLLLKEGGCKGCRCCCQTSQQSFREYYREDSDDMIWENEADYAEFDRGRRYAKRGAQIKSIGDKKARSLRARTTGSSTVCPSCGHDGEENRERKFGRESQHSSQSKRACGGKKVNAMRREVYQVRKMEDDVSHDSSNESDYVERSVGIRSRKARTKLIASAHQEEDDHCVSEEVYATAANSQRKRGDYGRLSMPNEDTNVAIISKNAVNLRRVDNEKHSTSLMKKHGEVYQRLVEQNDQELDKGVQKGSSLSVSSQRRREDQHTRQKVVELESRKGSRELQTVSGTHEYGTMMARSKKSVDESKFDMAESSASPLKQHHQVDKRVVGQAELRTDVSNEYFHNQDHVSRINESSKGSQSFLRMSEICEDNVNTISHNMLDSRKESKDISISTLKRHIDLDHKAVGSNQRTEHVQNLRRIDEIQSSNILTASNEERQHEQVMVRKTDDKLISVHKARDKRDQVDQQIIDYKELDAQYKNDFSGQKLRGNKINSSEVIAQSRIDDQADYSTSTVNLVYQAGRHQNQSRGGYEQSVSQSETGTKSSNSELSTKDSGRMSTAQIQYNSVTKNDLYIGQSFSRRESLKDTGIPQHSVTAPQRQANSQLICNTRIVDQKENSSLSLVQDEKMKANILTGENSQSKSQGISSHETPEGGSSSDYTHIQQFDRQTSKDEIYLVKGDILGSASRLESSSAMYVDDFVDKIRQETSSFKISSETSTEETHSKSHQETMSMQLGGLGVMSQDKDDKYIKESPRGSTSGSGIKGPSDEVWEVRNTISQEDNRKELGGNGLSAGIVDSTITSIAENINANSTITSTAENTNARRTSRSLWTHISDIIRMGWIRRAESHTSTHKSGKKSSSEGSEAWFSGQDASDNDNETNGQSSDLTQLLPVGAPIEQGHEAYSNITGGNLEAPDVVVMQSGITESTSMGVSRGYVSVGASIDSRPIEIELADNEKGSEDITSSTIPSYQVPPLIGSAPSVSMDEGISYTGNLTIPNSGSGYIEAEENLITDKISEVDKNETKNGDINRRKLQRNKQVLKETFEDWEEAYRLESEQRKIDEFFMREALVEAQKAADIWEVPVGAVLVHQGKIIARGFNLVEERRDSTAHAEMNCIREASNVLRTWRLAVIFLCLVNLVETTLYVTLEPCPMCAGAILQARIETVVWGAPNKLLGADGSWIRLFPGDGGSNSLDGSSQLPGPVHPFHPNIKLRRGVLATECSDVLQQFFQLRRKKIKKQQKSSPESDLPVPNHPIKLFTRMHNLFSVFCL
ncbi:hypothetical protein ZIOFF_064339 [Zingiber officinale]|uniref:tRNA(adenine(34)) deaminase n=1 Tax=Zingiber officinale TaxID=94328 RepID=A0A8J5EVU6_ZINOF|nr:hypothetical protein ZIOFF_064339 [Zingiber officinale]